MQFVIPTMYFADEDNKAFDQIAETVVNDSPEESSTEEVSQEEQEQEAKINEAVDKDEEFNKVSKNFNQNKDWRKLYYERSQAKRDLVDRESKVEELESKLEELAQREPELSEADIAKHASKLGLTLTKAEKEEIKDDLDSMFSKIESPTEREWWSNHAKLLQSKMMKGIEERYGDTLKSAQELIVSNRIDRSEKQARKHIDEVNTKHGTTIDFDKDVAPVLISMAKKDKSITTQNLDVFGLTEKWLASEGIGFGKQLSEKEQRKITEEKKKANVESTSPVSAPKTDDSNKSFEQIMAEETRKHSA